MKTRASDPASVAVTWFPTRGEAKPLKIDEIQAQSRSRSGILWIDCTDSTQLNQILKQLPVDEFSGQNIREQGGRTKLTVSGGVYQVPVFDCRLEKDSLRSEEITIAFTARWVLTVRLGPHKTNPFPIERVRKIFAIQRISHRSSSTGLLLWSILDTLMDRYFMVTTDVDDELDDCEELLLDDTAQSTGRAAARESRRQSLKLFALGKALIRFRRSALPLRDVVLAIVRQEIPFIDKTVRLHFQDVADHILRINDFVESQRDVVTGLRDAELALTSNRLSLVQQKIAAWGSLFLIATLVTGVLGMNFRDQPDLSWGSGFLVTASLILIICTPLYIFFRRREWV